MGVILEVLHLIAFLLELIGSVEGIVSLAGIEKLADILLVDFAALALTVGTMVATEAHTLIELYTEPLEALKYILLGTGNKAVGVSILNTENKFAIVLTGKQIVVQCRADTTDMQRTRWARCEPYSYFSFLHLYKMMIRQ